MKKSIFIALAILAGFLFISSRSTPQIIDEKPVTWFDSLNPPRIEVSPTSFDVPKPKTGKFVIRELMVYNKGGSPLEIIRAKGSCYCASATVLKSPIDTASSGKIMLYVNLDGLYEANNIIEYTIESNAVNSPTSVRITILPDTTKCLKK